MVAITELDMVDRNFMASDRSRAIPDNDVSVVVVVVVESTFIGLA